MPRRQPLAVAEIHLVWGVEVGEKRRHQLRDLEVGAIAEIAAHHLGVAGTCHDFVETGVTLDQLEHAMSVETDHRRCDRKGVEQGAVIHGSPWFDVSIKNRSDHAFWRSRAGCCSLHPA